MKNPLLQNTALLCSTLALGACTASHNTVSVDELLQNPLFAETYAEDVVNTMVNIEIRSTESEELRENGEFYETGAILDLETLQKVRDVRSTWVPVGERARQAQREGSIGNFVAVTEYATGEALLKDGMLYFGPTFDLAPAADLHVFLSNTVDPRAAEFPDETAVDLGPLQSPYGTQSYALTEAEGPYRTVVLWEQNLQRIWAFAQLRG